MISGFDVSFWNGNINWSIAETMANFAIIRVGQGTTIDKRFAEYWDGCTLPKGAYHFYDWRSGAASARAQGSFVRNMVTGNNLPIVMDFENPYTGWSSSPLPNRAERLRLMQEWRAGGQFERPMLYCNPAFLRELQPLPDWLTAEWLLWISQWYYKSGTTVTMSSPEEIGSKRPVTYGWAWSLWQYTNRLSGPLYGMQALGLDGNIFAGDDEAFKQFIGRDYYRKLTLEEKISMLWNGRCEYCGVIYENSVTCPKCGAPR